MPALPIIPPMGIHAFFFSSFQIVPNFSHVIEYHNLLGTADRGMRPISPGRDPGPWEVGSHWPWEELKHRMGRLWRGRGRWIARGWAHLLWLEQSSLFKLLQPFQAPTLSLSSLLYCECDCGDHGHSQKAKLRQSAHWEVYPNSLTGFLLISEGAFNGTGEEEGGGEASPKTIYPQQLMTLKNFFKENMLESIIDT